MYDPTTTDRIPIIPKGFGNSPIIIGDVISRKTGVNVVIGRVRERGESLIAFINNKEEITFREDVARSAIQKVEFTG